MKSTPQSLRKAAVLVASLDTATADALLDQVSDEQASTIRRMMVDLDEVSPQEQDAVIDELLRVSPLLPQPQPAGIELDRRLVRRLARVRDEVDVRSSGVEAAGAAEEPPFRLLHQAHGERLPPLLAHEHPQTIALVISHLPPQRAAESLATLDPPLQVNVIRRLIDLDEADPDILREVERGLESRILEQVQTERRRAAGLAAVSGILRAADAGLRSSILANLDHYDRELATRLGRRRLRFTDLEHLGNAALAAVFNAADPQLAVLALAGASPNLAQRIMGQLASRQAADLRRSMESLGPTPLSDIEEAQAQLAELAEQLADAGHIELPPC